MQQQHEEGRVRLPKDKAWNPHCGFQQRMRYLRQRWARVAKLKDYASVYARQRLEVAVAGEPDPAFAKLHLSHVALLAAEDVSRKVGRCSWAESINKMLDKFKASEIEIPE